MIYRRFLDVKYIIYIVIIYIINNKKEVAILEIRQLHYFLTVAEEMNFSRAAKRLHITQPPLSLQIQRLENELGVLLFRRTNRHVEITEAGREFMEDVQKIFEQLDRAVENAQRTHQGLRGKIRVGFVGSATYDVLPLVLREFRQKFPNVEVTLLELSTPRQLEALIEGQIDIGFLRPPIYNNEIAMMEVSKMPCVLAVPKNHPLLENPSLTLQELKPFPFVMLSPKTWEGLYNEIKYLCEPIIQQEALEFQTVIGLVAAGLGIAVVPQSAMNLHPQDVAFLDLNGQLPVVSMGISWRYHNTSPLVRSFIEVIKGNRQRLDP